MARFKAEALTPLSKAQALIITSTDHYVVAGELKKSCRDLRQKITGWFRGTKADPGPLTMAHDAWQKLIDREKEALTPLKTADDVLEKKMLAWNSAKEQERQAAQKAAEAEAQRKAEDERLAAAVILADEAERQGDAGLMAAAEEMINLPIDVAPIYVASEVPKIAGVVKKKETYIEVTNMRALVLAVAAGELLKEVGPLAESDRRVVADFLRRYQPVENGLEPTRIGKDSKVEGAGVFDVYTSWIRSGFNQKRAAFFLPGVITEERDAIV